MTWGQLRSTDDAEGEVLEESSLVPEREQVEEVLAEFLPSYMQVPPNYSAIKVGGRRAYKKARAGEDFVLLPRLVQLYEAAVQKHGDGKTVIKIQCGKGFYVRSLAVDIACKLRGLAYVSSLRRVRVGNFSEKDAILLAKEEEVVYSAMVQDCILPVSAVLDDILVQQVSVDQAHKLMNGVALESAAICSYSGVDEVVVCCGELPVAICCLDNGLLKPRRVFNLLKKRSVSDVDYKG
jgi:tRNA pseudouridine55 synthase